MGLTEEDFVVVVAASQWASVNKKQKKTTPLDNDKEDAEEPSKKKSKNGMETDTKPLDNTTTTTCWLADLDEIANTAKSRLGSNSKATARAMISSEEFERIFSRTEKSTLGSKLKQLLDLCRAARLQELGYNVDLVVYTTRSLEDRLLVASQSNWNMIAWKKHLMENGRQNGGEMKDSSERDSRIDTFYQRSRIYSHKRNEWQYRDLPGKWRLRIEKDENPKFGPAVSLVALTTLVALNNSLVR
jgi:hypothetical protein